MCSNHRKPREPQKEQHDDTTRVTESTNDLTPVTEAPKEPPPVLQCILTFSPVNGGCFVVQWSDPSTSETPEDAIALFFPSPSKHVPQYKLKAREELIRDAGGPNARKFYEGYIAFIRSAAAYDGKLKLIKNLDFRPGAHSARTETTGHQSSLCQT